MQAARGRAHVVLTGGGVGTATLKALAGTPARDAVDWSAVDVWWGDERFLPEGHPDRNETQARAALLDHVPLDPARVHAMPAAGVLGEDVERGRGVRRGAGPGGAARGAGRRRPSTCSCSASGPDGHVASLFPEHPALDETDRTVVGSAARPSHPRCGSR